MPFTAITSAPAARAGFDANFSSKPGLPRSSDEHQADARAHRASLTRQRTGRRRFVDPTCCDADRAAAEDEFMRAMDEYKQRSGRMFPTWSEVLEVLQGLGYEKISSPSAVQDGRSRMAACG
jgi:hypothetical protein